MILFKDPLLILLIHVCCSLHPHLIQSLGTLSGTHKIKSTISLIKYCLISHSMDNLVIQFPHDFPDKNVSVYFFLSCIQN